VFSSENAAVAKKHADKMTANASLGLRIHSSILSYADESKKWLS
jgi:hypothetical protein